MVWINKKKTMDYSNKGSHIRKQTHGGKRLLGIACFFFFCVYFATKLVFVPTLINLKLFDKSDTGRNEGSGVVAERHHWTPEVRQSLEICMNLEQIVKNSGNATIEETKIWKKLECLDELRNFHRLWYNSFFPT
jgi:hypothetical protein